MTREDAERLVDWPFFAELANACIRRQGRAHVEELWNQSKTGWRVISRSMRRRFARRGWMARGGVTTKVIPAIFPSHVLSDFHKHLQEIATRRGITT